MAKIKALADAEPAEALFLIEFSRGSRGLERSFYRALVIRNLDLQVSNQCTIYIFLPSMRLCKTSSR